MKDAVVIRWDVPASDLAEVRRCSLYPFMTPSSELDKLFVQDALNKNLLALKGHRSIGGIRASIYNAMSMEGVESLVSFMVDFEKSSG